MVICVLGDAVFCDTQYTKSPAFSPKQAKVDLEGGKPSAVNRLLGAATAVFDVFSR